MRATPWPLEVVDESAIGPELDGAIRRLLCQCFPADAEAFARSRAWHGERPSFVVLCREGNAVVGHLAIVIRVVSIGGVRARVAGVQGLSVTPRCRAGGLARELLRLAQGELAARGVRSGILFCLPELEAFYGRLGWQKTERPVTTRDEKGQPILLSAKNICMLSVLEDATLPPGPIDLGCRDW